jgi:hypothetical protein
MRPCIGCIGYISTKAGNKGSGQEFFGRALKRAAMAFGQGILAMERFSVTG